MNQRRIKLERLLQLVMVICLVGFCSVVQAQAVVQLRVNVAEDKLIIETPGTCKKLPVTDGCLFATRGNTHVNFNLVGNKDCSESGKKWELDSVVLGTSEGSPGSIGSVAAADFDAVEATGFVNPTSINASHIAIQNYNSKAYDIWYTVTAICVDGTSVIDSDPRIENDGSGYN